MAELGSENGAATRINRFWVGLVLDTKTAMTKECPGGEPEYSDWDVTLGYFTDTLITRRRAWMVPFPLSSV